MVKWHRWWSGCGLCAVVALGLSACAAKAPVKGPQAYAMATETPMPTVPPATPTPEVAASPLPTHPIGNKEVKARKGHPIGPVITFFGAVRADGSTVDPVEVSKGVPVYRSAAGSGFMLVLEAKAGENGFEPGRRVFAYVPDDPKQRPDLQIESSRDMGNGSPAVCDRRLPNIGGIPGINPANFAETQHISDALNDFGCRFETFIESDSSCTLTKSGDYSFVSKDTTTQFCMIVAHAYAFPEGRTLLTARLLDSEGNPGPTKQIWIWRPPAPKKKR